MVALYALEDQELLKRCVIKRGKAQGPGGQHRHAHASGITITCVEIDVSASAGTHRSAQVNQKRALHVLRLRLAMQQRGLADPECVNPYRHQKKIKINPANKDFPHVIAYLLDVLEEFGHQLSAASEKLAISSSQIIKTLALEKELWQFCQQRRAAFGLSPLKMP